jgi:hypothetical protein
MKPILNDLIYKFCNHFEECLKILHAVADQGRGHYGQVLGASRFWGPRASQSQFFATVVTNVETALKIYLTMMVSLRSLDLSTLANSFVSAQAKTEFLICKTFCKQVTKILQFAPSNLFVP